MNARMGRGRPGLLRAVLGTVAGLAVVGSLGMFSDRSAHSKREAGAPVIVRVSGSGVVETEMDGPDDSGAPAREAAVEDPAEAAQMKVPRFLGTFQMSGESRAIFEVQGKNAPWMGKAGERIEGTEFVLEAFDGTSARIVPIEHK
jgi:hypothetical protein